jgi:hypothetical protein
MTNTGAIVSSLLVSPKGDACKGALLKVGQCRNANKQAGDQAGAQVGDQQKGAETAEDEHNKEQRIDLMSLLVGVSIHSCKWLGKCKRVTK